MKQLIDEASDGVVLFLNEAMNDFGLDCNRLSLIVL